MGFMDNFTSDSPVTVKQPDYYEMPFIRLCNQMMN